MPVDRLFTSSLPRIRNFNEGVVVLIKLETQPHGKEGIKGVKRQGVKEGPP